MTGLVMIVCSLRRGKAAVILAIYCCTAVLLSGACAASPWWHPQYTSEWEAAVWHDSPPERLMSKTEQAAQADKWQLWKKGRSVLSVGIDVGTSFSRIALYKHGEFKMLATIPSVMVFRADSSGSGLEAFVGHAALQHLYESGGNISKSAIVTGSVKHLLGLRFDHPMVEELQQLVAYQIVDADGQAHVRLQAGNISKAFSPAELYSLLLKELTAQAQAALQQSQSQCLEELNSVKFAVISLPADFDKAQMDAARHAADLSGLTVHRFVKNPIAAAMAYRLHKLGSSFAYSYSSSTSEDDVMYDVTNLLVVDAGGGSVEASVLLMDQRVMNVLASSAQQIITTSGHDLSRTVQQQLFNNMTRQSSLMLPGPAPAPAAVESATTLQDSEQQQQHSSHLDAAIANKMPCKGPHATAAAVTSEEHRAPAEASEAPRSRPGEDFDEVYRAMWAAVHEVVQISRAANIPKRLTSASSAVGTAAAAAAAASSQPVINITHVLLVGGHAHSRKLQQLLRSYFPLNSTPKVHILQPGTALDGKGVPPEEAAVYGAAVQAAILSGPSGVADAPWQLPCCHNTRPSHHNWINRPECAEWTECPQKLFISDVAVWSLGVEVEGGVMDALMPRNTIVTNHKCREYATAVDNQTAMTIKVFAGESALTQNNWEIGQLVFDDIPAAPAGKMKLLVSIEVRHVLDGEMTRVTATNPVNGLTKSFTVSRRTYNTAAWDADDYHRILTEAEAAQQSEKQHVFSRMFCEGMPNSTVTSGISGTGRLKSKLGATLVPGGGYGAAAEHGDANSDGIRDAAGNSYVTTPAEKRDAHAAAAERENADDQQHIVLDTNSFTEGSYTEGFQQVMQAVQKVKHWMRAHHLLLDNGAELRARIHNVSDNEIKAKLAELQGVCATVCSHFQPSIATNMDPNALKEATAAVPAAAAADPGAAISREAEVATFNLLQPPDASVQRAPHQALRFAIELCGDVAAQHAAQETEASVGQKGSVQV